MVAAVFAEPARKVDRAFGDIVGMERGDFLRSLAAEDEQTDDCGKTALFASGRPDGFQFVV